MVKPVGRRNREPAQVPKGGEVLEEVPFADSAEESPYIHPASKSRFGSQHKVLRSEPQRQHVSGTSKLACLPQHV